MTAVREEERGKTKVLREGIDTGGTSRRPRSRRDRDTLKRNTRNKQQHKVVTQRDNSLRMQNIKNEEGENTRGTRGGLKRREKSNSTSVMELWAEKERKEEEQAKKRMRQKKEQCDEIFKRSKLVERTPSKSVERENEAEDGNNEWITERIKE